MGRYYFDKKVEADGLKNISVWFLKKHGYFEGGWKNGTITWSINGEKTGSVSIYTAINNNDKYLRLNYQQTNFNSGEKKDFDYKIPLTTTPCNFGGNRHWFICPWYKMGVYCGRRVGVLYLSGGYFACRHCNELTYESCNRTGIFKTLSSSTTDEVERLRISLRTTHYKGKPTKRFVSYVKKHQKLTKSLVFIEKMLN